MTAYEALVEHFTFHERTDPEGIAHNALAVLLNLPLDERMKAMGMERVEPFETFIAGDGEPAIRGRTDVWAEKKGNGYQANE